jgi:hypothetical protein
VNGTYRHLPNACSSSRIKSCLTASCTCFDCNTRFGGSKQEPRVFQKCSAAVSHPQHPIQNYAPSSSTTSYLADCTSGGFPRPRNPHNYTSASHSLSNHSPHAPRFVCIVRLKVV